MSTLQFPKTTPFSGSYKNQTQLKPQLRFSGQPDEFSATQAEQPAHQPSPIRNILSRAALILLTILYSNPIHANLFNPSPAGKAPEINLPTPQPKPSDAQLKEMLTQLLNAEPVLISEEPTFPVEYKEPAPLSPVIATEEMSGGGVPKVPSEEMPKQEPVE